MSAATSRVPEASQESGPEPLVLPSPPQGRRSSGSAPLWTAPSAPLERSAAARLATAVPGAVLLPLDIATFLAAMGLTGTVNLKTLVVLVLVVALFHTADLYRSRLSLSVLDDGPALVGRSLAAGAGAMVLGGLDDGVAGTARLGTAAAFACLCLATRALAYTAIRLARRRQRLGQRTLLLGAGTLSGALARNLATHPEYGLRPVGMLDDDPLLTDDERPVPLLGGYSDLFRVVVEERIHVVIVTYGSAREGAVVDTLRACDRLACEIYFIPRLYELHAVTRGTEVLWGIPLVRLRRAALRTGSWSGKRIGDMVLSALALLLLSPVLVVGGLLSRLETGSFLFRQIRIGQDGRPFTLLKLCSMRPEQESESTTRWNIAGDQRMGPVGRVLRRTSLDELPQLWNVLRGDMSLVGPRPERPFFVDEFTRRYPRYPARHRVPAGLTGWAQIHGLRGDTSIADRASFDNYYIENWSMWGDIKILLRTAGQVVRAAGR